MNRTPTTPIALKSAIALTLILSAGLAFAQPASKPEIKPDSKQVAPPATAPQKEPTLKVGDKAPAIKVTKWVKGQEVTGFEKGKVYVVEFWATWCKPCLDSIPHLTKLQKEHKDITIIGVAGSERKPESGSDQRLTKLESFVKARGSQMEYTVAYDADRAMVKDWMEPAGRTGIPAAFLVDREGKIAWIGHPARIDAPLAEALGQSDKSKKDSKKDPAKKDADKKEKTAR
ncbi:MAG: redoxin family protein [Phycisphaerales bacterium]|nr:redoxin family protein [Phycisphaerales bacterium]